MEENISHVLSLVGSVFLFVISLSCSIFAYNGLENRLELFFDMHTITARREDATSELLDASTIQREARFEEIFMSILNLPKYVTFDTIYSGDVGELQINGDVNKTIDVQGTVFSVSGDFDDVNYVTTCICIDNDESKMYNISLQSELDDLIEEIILAACNTSVVMSGNSSNAQLAAIKDTIGTTTFSVSYDENTIYYVRN